MTTREQIMQSLFNLVSGAAGFVTTGRRLKLWTDVAANAKPALFMYEPDDMYSLGNQYTQVVEMNVDLFIYTAPGMDSGVTPVSIMNPLLDAIDTALKPSPINNRQTLGGLVSHCWIDGKVMKDPGDIDGDGIAVIPVKILATL